MKSALVLVVITSGVLSVVINALVRYLARMRGWAKGPQSGRHIHRSPTPRLGGIGVFFSSCVAAGMLVLLLPSHFSGAKVFTLFAPAALAFALGIWDDFRPVPAKVKLIFQIVCAVSMFGWMRHTALAYQLKEVEFGSIILLVASVAWIVVVSNSINLIDGMDGLAGGTVCLSLIAIALVAASSGHWDVAAIAVVIVGAVIGFLPFNMNPATMFLGDGGSLYLGFLISALALGWGDSNAIGITIAVAALILVLPLAETGLSVARRFLGARSIFVADREHIHHKLLDRGLSQRQAVNALYCVAAIGAGTGIAVAFGGLLTVVLSAAALVVTLISGVVLLRYVEFLEISRIFRRMVEQRRIVANDVAIRKIAGRVKQVRCFGELGDELEAAFRGMTFDGSKLLVTSFVEDVAPCALRSSLASWGCSIDLRTQDPAYWTMSIDLLSRRYGKLGRLCLARKADRGSLLFDANLFVTELQPAAICALERCLMSCCFAGHDKHVKERKTDEDALVVIAKAPKSKPLPDNSLNFTIQPD
jgi:UDP-GlcNAc:undecaprenyl-phosphate/decaprenyl-phosphate GlcNAc-1-phosphate transferase